uniref:Uncharacterized protein n=1 Tax=Chryseobacterium endophyticum TaxID=1854762 RepID=A0AAU6WJP7_9FLAO
MKEEVINIINLLREERILADTKDLSAFIKKGENKNRSLSILETFCKIENFLLSFVEQQEKIFHIKELNEKAEQAGCSNSSTQRIKTVFNFWSIKNWIKRRSMEYSKNHLALAALYPTELLKDKLEKGMNWPVLLLISCMKKAFRKLHKMTQANRKYWWNFPFTNLNPLTKTARICLKGI